MSKMLFDRPYFVTPHAVQRFRERVADLPAREIIRLVCASLQVRRRPLYAHRLRDRRLCRVFGAKYAGIDYGIPVVCNRDHDWPAVPTSLGPEEIRRNIQKYKEGS